MPAMAGLGRTTLPERTVDAWVAMYLATRLRSVLLWAPTQRTAVDFDFSVAADGKLFVLEQKAPVVHLRHGNHWLEVDVPQLWRYCTHPQIAGLVWYVLPQPPYPAPSAAARGASLLPALAASRSAGHQWGGAPCDDWFQVVPARALYAWLSMRPGWRYMPSAPRYGAALPLDLVRRRAFPCSDLSSGGPAGRMTLRQWVDALRRCDVEGGRIEGGRLVHAGRLVHDGELLDDGEALNLPLDEPLRRLGDAAAGEPSSDGGSERTRALFVPAGDLPGWASRG